LKVIDSKTCYLSKALSYTRFYNFRTDST